MPSTKRRKRSPRLTARTADKHDLYVRAVQGPDADVRFIRRVFRKERGREAVSLREDFCGSAAISAEWVRGRNGRTAVGLDLHQPTLDWGWRRFVEPLGAAAERVTLMRRDVLRGTNEKFDAICAFNFSYSVFKDRETLLRYFRRARNDLTRDGSFMLDLYGGPEAQIETEEETDFGDFTYVWDQRPIDAVSHQGKRYIHFRFPDGTSIERAFTYDWRLWTLPELRDLIAEAGFRRSDVYWEGADDDGEGNGIYRRVRRADNEDAWVAYLVAWR